MTRAPASWVRYTVVWVTLLVLGALQFCLSFAHLGSAGTFVSLAIASAMALLVLLFYMHLIEERFSVMMAPIVALLLIVLLVSLVVTDVATRHTFPKGPLPYVTSPDAVE